MNLHLNCDEWERFTATGQWVMFSPPHNRLGPDGRFDWMAPFWMVEAAKPCKTCHGQRKIRVPYSPVVVEVFNTSLVDCPDCDDGRQWHTITVPCEEPGCPHVGPCNRGKDGRGYITVPELAIVEWGPLPVQQRDVTEGPEQLVPAPGRPPALWLWSDHGKGKTIYLPSDIDPQSLVGQHAIGGTLVTP